MYCMQTLMCVSGQALGIQTDFTEVRVLLVGLPQQVEVVNHINGPLSLCLHLDQIQVLKK